MEARENVRDKLRQCLSELSRKKICLAPRLRLRVRTFDKLSTKFNQWYLHYTFDPSGKEELDS